jgi:hypothetical protein
MFFITFFINVLTAQNLPDFGERIDMGVIENDDLVEASGLVASRKNNQVLWSHNDRNNQDRLFALNSRGEHLGIFWLDGIVNRDWEDMAIGPGPEEGVDYLYIGDIGDNEAVNDLKYIYRVPEPDVDPAQEPSETTLFNIETITVQYPDTLRDSETMMIDPLTRDIYIVSKRELNDIRVYRVPYPQSTSEVIIAELVAILNLTQLVGGDISPSGFEILMKTYTTMYYWKRNPEENLWDAFSNEPVFLPYVEEMQGETVCWAADSMGYFTLSEENLGIPVHLFFYPRKNPLTVVINEIMSNPSSVDDSMGEWFEIYNNSIESVDLNGWAISDLGTDFHEISQSLILSPGEYLVMGNNSNQNSNGGVSIDYQYSNFDLDNSNDEIFILSPDENISDHVDYNDMDLFPITIGKSFALLDPNLNNQAGLNWVESNAVYGDGDLGTSGSPNAAAVQSPKIRDIQFTTEPIGNSPLIDQRVTISGIVSVDPFGSFFKDFLFIQDDNAKWSGIMIKHTAETSKGDSVSLTGTVADDFGSVTTLIDVTNFEIHKPDAGGMEPIAVSTGEIANGGEFAEAYESVLIKVTGNCDNDNLGFREWSVDDGSGPVRIYHPLSNEISGTIGTFYEITGVQYFRNGDYKIIVLDPENVLENPQGLHQIENIPKVYSLHQNHPNPFNPRTIINYELPITNAVELSIYNLLGQKVVTLVSEKKNAGHYQIEWDATRFSSGVYYYKIEAGAFKQVKKMVLLR